MKILAVIPARAGSKRLPNKNKLLLGGKPLIIWSIDAAQGIPEICDILVSTDDPEIADISKNAGALVPWLRPAELATDTATSVDVALHALDWYEKEKGEIDGILLLQPTSPFRKKTSLIAGIEKFVKSLDKSVIGVSPTHYHPMWMLKIGNEGFLQKFIDGDGVNIRSQDLPPAFFINGTFYLISPTNIRKEQSFFSEKTLPLTITDELEAIDIDTEFDFKVAKRLICTAMRFCNSHRIQVAG